MTRQPVNTFVDSSKMPPPMMDRRHGDISDAVKLAVLENEMKAISSSVTAMADDISEIKSSLMKLAFESEKRSDSFSRIEMEQAMIKSDLRDHITREEQLIQGIAMPANRVPEDGLEALKKKVFTVLQIGAGIIAILAMLVFAEHNLLSPQAAQELKSVEKAVH